MHAPAYYDIAHFVAEAWLYDRFNPPSPGSKSIYTHITRSLLTSYRSRGGTVDLQSALYYVAGHIICFLRCGNWTESDDIRRTVALEAVRIIELASLKDWTQLKTFGLIDVVIPEQEDYPSAIR